jgi:hypothetical protein
MSSNRVKLKINKSIEGIKNLLEKFKSLKTKNEELKIVNKVKKDI